MKTKTRILIVDDHEVVREGIKALLASKKSGWVICGEATDSNGAVERTRILMPDLVLMDISLPGIGGLEASSQIRKMGLTMPILMFTTHDFERLDAYVRKAGAQGFVQKSQAFRDLIGAIECLLAGGTFFGVATSDPGPAMRIPPVHDQESKSGVRGAVGKDRR